jgi:RNA polymerase sigma-32 factor
MKTKAKNKKPETQNRTRTASKPKLPVKRVPIGKRSLKEARAEASTAEANTLQAQAPPKPGKSDRAKAKIKTRKKGQPQESQPLNKYEKTRVLGATEPGKATRERPADKVRLEAAPIEDEGVENIPDEPIEEEGARPLKSQKSNKIDKSDSSDKALVKFDPLQRYLSEISKYRLLTREEEREYGLRVKEHGDKDAAYALVTANLRLVVKIALEFQRVWMQNLLDLIQEGNIGLMQAVKKFDPYKNVKFSYYASFWIKAYILKFIMDNWRLVKIGTTQGQRKLFFKLKKEKQRLIDQGFDPKPKLLSERLGVSEREIVDMDQRLDSWDVSLDAPLKNDSETERIEFLSTDNESVEEQVSKKEIELLLHNKITEFRKKMTPREIEIFELRIFSDNPVTLQEIGDRYGISRERVRQVEKNIIRKMRDFFKREIPDFASYAEDTGME